MKKLDYLPDNYSGVKVVDSLSALFNEPFGDANVIIFPRTLRGDFNNVARQLHKRPKNPRDELDGAHSSYLGGYLDHESRLVHLAKNHPTSGLGIAAKAILDDIKAVGDLLALGSTPPHIRLAMNNGWSGEGGVEKFHVDTACRREIGRVLCCYTAPATQWLRNDEAVREGEYYKPAPGATIYNFQPGDIFRIKSHYRQASIKDIAATEQQDPSYRDNCFIHRVPNSSPQELARAVPRLLWVAG